MECKVTCFDRIIHLTEKLPTEKLREAVAITLEESFVDLLEFCVENGCFTQEQSNTIYDFVIMWEDLDGTYYEEDYDKLQQLYEAIGLTREVVNNYTAEK